MFAWVPMGVSFQKICVLSGSHTLKAGLLRKLSWAEESLVTTEARSTLWPPMGFQ